MKREAMGGERADIESSTDDYAARFSGPVGTWMLDLQERITTDLLAPFRGGSILDVGGGHGQLAVPLARKGWDITVQGSALSCRRRIDGALGVGACPFVVGGTRTE